MGLSTKSGTLSERDALARYAGELQHANEQLRRAEADNARLRAENAALRAQLADQPDPLYLRWLETRQFLSA